MLARISRYEIAPERCDEAVEAFTTAGRDIAAMDGFHSGYVLVEPETGALMTFTLWQDQQALDASATRAASARRRAIAVVEGDVLSVQTFDVVRELGR
jgi:heme-degrading monooxygenase HmoA